MGVPAENRRRAVLDRAQAKGKKAARRKKLSPEAQRRVSEKIEALEKAGECKGPGGHEKCVAMAHSMERAGRLRRGGVYVPAKKGK